jgi:uncharacterized protein YegP (UPF0339 family)
MKAIIKKTKSGEFRFNLTGNNGEKIATSETYKSKQMAVKTLTKCFPEYEIVDETKLAPKKKAPAKKK